MDKTIISIIVIVTIIIAIFTTWHFLGVWRCPGVMIMSPEKQDYTPWDIDIRGSENSTVMASGVIMINCKSVTVDRGGEDQLIKCEKLPTNHDKKTGELK